VTRVRALTWIFRHKDLFIYLWLAIGVVCMFSSFLVAALWAVPTFAVASMWWGAVHDPRPVHHSRPRANHHL
jgi:hypothetical protein